MTLEELRDIRVRLTGSHGGPWAPDYKLAKECGGRSLGLRLLDEIERLRAVLEWYADVKNYVVPPSPMEHEHVRYDLGQRARKALQKADV